MTLLTEVITPDLLRESVMATYKLEAPVDDCMCCGAPLRPHHIFFVFWYSESGNEFPSTNGTLVCRVCYEKIQAVNPSTPEAFIHAE